MVFLEGVTFPCLYLYVSVYESVCSIYSIYSFRRKVMTFFLAGLVTFLNTIVFLIGICWWKTRTRALKVDSTHTGSMSSPPTLRERRRVTWALCGKTKRNKAKAEITVTLLYSSLLTRRTCRETSRRMKQSSFRTPSRKS